MNSQPWIEHEIGTTGEVLVRGADGELTVRGVSGGVARVRGLGAVPLDEDYRVEMHPGGLEIVPRERLPFAIVGLMDKGTQPLEVEVPLDAAVRAETASGSIEVRGTRGNQRYRSASGEITLDAVRGSISAETVSGDVKLEADGQLAAGLRTVSGDMECSAPSYRRIRVRTMSGDLRLAGSLDGSGSYELQSVSGDVDLELSAPFRVELTTVSGELRAPGSVGVSGYPGRRTTGVGKDGPLVSVRTISGDVRLGQPEAQPSRPPSPGPAPDARLAILRDLEAGTIDVDEAGRRLSELDASSPSTAAGDAETDQGDRETDREWRWDRARDGSTSSGASPSRLRATSDDRVSWFQRA